MRVRTASPLVRDAPRLRLVKCGRLNYDVEMRVPVLIARRLDLPHAGLRNVSPCAALSELLPRRGDSLDTFVERLRVRHREREEPDRRAAHRAATTINIKLLR